MVEWKRILPWFSILFCLKPLSFASQVHQTSIGCGSSFCCLQWPPGCTPLKDCGIIIRYKYDASQHMLDVEIHGQVDGWIAFGLNRKKGVMGGVKGEICYKKGSSVMLQQFENEGTDFHFRGEVKNTIIKLEMNGTIVCSYRRPLHGPNMFDLTELFYIVSAWGKMKQKGGKVKPREHPTGGYFWTSEKVDLKGEKCGTLESRKWKLIAFHGALMVIAWVALASTGILFMRYTRPLFGERTLLSKKVWFQVHRISLFLALILTLAGVVLVFVQAGSWRTEMGAHPYTGVAVLFFAVLQPVCAFFRPSPADERRWIFNWGHRLGGVTCIVLAIVTIFLGMAYMETTPAVLIVYLVLMIIAVVLMEFKQCCRSKTVVIQANDMEELYVEEDFDSLRLDSRLRKIFISFAVVLGVLSSIIIIALLAARAANLTDMRPS